MSDFEKTLMRRTDIATAIVDIANELNEWRDAGGDSLEVAGAIQRLVFAIVDATTSEAQSQ